MIELHMPDCLVIGAGLMLIGMGIWCAILEERECLQLPRECAALGPVLFDGYRAVAVAGGVTTCVGIANLLLPHVMATSPIGVSWAWKVGSIFFLYCRIRFYRDRQHHAWRPHILPRTRRS